MNYLSDTHTHIYTYTSTHIGTHTGTDTTGTRRTWKLFLLPKFMKRSRCHRNTLERGRQRGIKKGRREEGAGDGEGSVRPGVKETHKVEGEGGCVWCV